ncbi:MAG: RNA-binding protein [candidate division KSB1 bacterium]|nr:RNA-binding protein [candidate division KSB1 bacterium]MDZ7319056.1 RNA-binding protein [candidate division KSB1 bacterium]MDZ7341609.1 RNA-binding protein [candidate division KSB1 bacterium]
MNIYIGNLAAEVTEDDLREAFGAFGEITSVKVIKDRFTGEPRGFGFVEMPAKQAAKTAMESLNGQEIKGKKMIVNEARADKRQGGGNAGRGSGGRRGWSQRY